LGVGEEKERHYFYLDVKLVIRPTATPDPRIDGEFSFIDREERRT
jgi:hypothetical protein